MKSFCRYTAYTLWKINAISPPFSQSIVSSQPISLLTPKFRLTFLKAIHLAFQLFSTAQHAQQVSQNQEVQSLLWLSMDSLIASLLEK